MTGYQQENERLYKELKQMQAKEKASQARMFSENQKLGKMSVLYFIECVLILIEISLGRACFQVLFYHF